MDNQWREELIDSMKELTQDGFRCFILKENPSYLYGFMITPSDNILYIQRDSFKWRGWTVSLNYRPGNKTGSGCQCFEEPFEKITTNIILRAEKEGLSFAHKLKANLYKNSEEYLENLWNSENYEEVTI